MSWGIEAYEAFILPDGSINPNSIGLNNFTRVSSLNNNSIGLNNENVDRNNTLHTTSLRVNSEESPLTGTVSTNIGSTTVTGNGTLFTQELNVGNYINIGFESYYIESITSDTVLDIINIYTFVNNNVDVNATFSSYGSWTDKNSSSLIGLLNFDPIDGVNQPVDSTIVICTNNGLVNSSGSNYFRNFGGENFVETYAWDLTTTPFADNINNGAYTSTLSGDGFSSARFLIDIYDLGIVTNRTFFDRDRTSLGNIAIYTNNPSLNPLWGDRSIPDKFYVDNATSTLEEVNSNIVSGVLAAWTTVPTGFTDTVLEVLIEKGGGGGTQQGGIRAVGSTRNTIAFPANAIITVQVKSDSNGDIQIYQGNASFTFTILSRAN